MFIHIASGTGYRLSVDLDLLDKKLIIELLQETSLQLAPYIEILSSVPSTNDYLLNALSEEESLHIGNVVLVEEQTSGKGRMGRTWISPYATNLYLSIYWKFVGPFSKLNGLSLVMGLAVVNAITTFGLEQIKVKWPNDLYCQDKKLGGILIETNYKSGGPIHVVIGIGVNVKNDVGLERQLQQPCIDLQTCLGKNISRSWLAAAVILEVYKYLEIFSQEGFKCFMSTWAKRDYLMGKEVEVMIGATLYKGRVEGLDKSGALQLKCCGNDTILKSRNRKTLSIHSVNGTVISLNK